MRLISSGFYQDNIKRFAPFLSKIIRKGKTMRGVEIGGISMAIKTARPVFRGGPMAGLRPMVLDDINAPDLGGSFKPLGEIRFNTIVSRPARSESKVISSEPVDFVMPKVEPMVLPKTEPEEVKPRSDEADRRARSVWKELREQPDVTDELLARVHKAKAAMDKIRLDRVQPRVEPQVVLDLSRKIATKSSPRVSFVTPLIREEQVEVAAARQEQSTKPLQEQVVSDQQEEKTILKKKFLVDIRKLVRRIFAATLGVVKAKFEASRLGLKKIPGWLVNKFMYLNDKDKISELVEPEGPDGSISETLEEIGSQEFNSINEAQQTSVKVILKNVPVRIGKIHEAGEQASDEAVVRVRKFHFIKKPKLLEVLASRIIKKREIKMVSIGNPAFVTPAEVRQERNEMIENFPAFAAAVKAA